MSFFDRFVKKSLESSSMLTDYASALKEIATGLADLAKATVDMYRSANNRLDELERNQQILIDTVSQNQATIKAHYDAINSLYDVQSSMLQQGNNKQSLDVALSTTKKQKDEKPN